MTTSGDRVRLQVFATAGALAHAAAEQFAKDAAGAVEASGRFTVALSGGTTPKALYDRLRRNPYRSRIPWSHIEWFWSDERCVGPDDPASNYRMARDALLDRVPIAEERVHRIRGEDPPAVAAAAYEAQLRATFGTPTGPPARIPGARFDLVLLGLGQDGHTASLFPGQGAVLDSDRWVVAQSTPAVPEWRVTLTPVVINAAARVIFLVVGAEKAETLERVLEGPSVPATLPAQVIAPLTGDLFWFVDASAAAQLSRRTG